MNINFTMTPDWVTAIATIILVLATCVYVYFSYKLTKETIKLREVETSPFISISFDTTFVSKFKLNIKNIGKSPAYNLSFELDEKYLNFFNYKFDQKISYFAPEQQFSILSSGYKELDESEYNNIPITVIYFSKDGRKFIDTFLMEWKHLDSTLIEKSTLEGMQKSFDDLNKEIKEINKTLKNKKYFVSNKLSVLEIEKKDNYVQFIFSNGEICKIEKKQISDIGFKDMENVYIDDGDIQDFSTRTKFTAEEIFNNIKNLIKDER
jgi:Ca2+/Na+ antiporter